MSSVAPFLSLADEELETSRLLLSNQHYRAAVSRAYYAMYYATQALLASRNVTSRTHKGIIQQFSQHFVKPGELPTQMVTDLKRVYDLRQLSDYEAAVVLTLEQANIALGAAADFVHQVQTYLNATPS